MKRNTCLLLVLLFPLLGISQGVKTNLFDQFLKKQRIETEPVTITGLAGNNRLSIDFSAIASSLYLNLSGTGWGASTIDRDNELVLLFANDSSLSLRSAALQSFEPGAMQNVYRHQYQVSFQDLERLSRYDLVGLRKYSFTSSSELGLPRENAGEIRRLSALFRAAVQKANLATGIRQVNVRDIRSYVGDSVSFCSKVYRTRYFQGSEDGPTLLDVQADFSDPFVNVVILEKDRPAFNGAPETSYLNKDVCISGVVRLRNNLPYLVIRNREQIRVTTPVPVSEAALFTGDSITVVGNVITAQQRGSGKAPQLILGIGTTSANRLLTVVVDQGSVGESLSGSAYLRQGVRATGRVVRSAEGLQMLVSNKNQLQLLDEQDASLSFVAARDEEKKNGKATDRQPNGAGTVTETLAEFPGGAMAFQAYLEKNIAYPAKPSEAGNRQVVASFLIDAQGACSGIRITGSPGAALEEAIRKALQAMPKWKPAFSNGRFVATRITQPIQLSNKP